MLFRSATSVLLKAIAAALLLYSLPDTWRNYSAMLYIGHLCIVLCIYIACFRLTPAKLLYTLLFLQAASTTVNFTASAVIAPFFPGIRVSMTTVPAYTVAMGLGNLIAIPIVWRFFKGRLYAAFEELDNKTLWLLCLPPILFLLLNQIFVTEIQQPTDFLLLNRE